MKILLTNDDGLDSPALIPTIEMLEEIGEVKVVIPRKEQSWTSKSNDRRGKNITLEYFTKAGRDILTLDSRPADCSNFGLHMNEEFPDLLISGANVGHNIGLSAFFSSGTIGAALEGLLIGVPSIAISCPYESRAQLIEGAFYKSLSGVDKLISEFIKNRQDDYLLMNLNIPLGKKEKTLMATKIDRFSYGKLFEEDDKGLIQPIPYPRLSYPSENEIQEGTDAWARYKGIGSVVMLDQNAQFHDPKTIQNWLERHKLQSLS